MRCANNNLKNEIIYSLISAGFYTLLYFILSLLNSGPGFQNSMVARFAIGELLMLAFYIVILSFAGFLAIGILYGMLVHLLTKLGINDDDATGSALGWMISIPIILYFSVALGFVSIGVF